MRLVIWHTDDYPTAPGVYLDCFPPRGHEVTWVVSATADRAGVVESRAGGVRRIEVRRRRDARLPRPAAVLANRWNKLVAFAHKVRLMERLARERPDVLQVRDLVTEGLLALGAARRHGVRFAYQLDHPHFEARMQALDLGGRRAPLERAWLGLWIALRRVVLRGADLVFPISAAMLEWLRDHEGVDPRRMVPFPVGVSRATHERGGGCAVDPRAAALAGEPTVCYVGSLDLRRDPGLIFAVLDEVARRVPGSRFLVVGRWSDLVRRRLEGTAAAERVTFVPHVPHEEVPDLMHAARVGIFPLAVDDAYQVYRTSSPLKVVEYMSAGLPVVSSPVPDAADALAGSGAGVCVAAEPAVFAEAVAAYLRDPERARADGARGRAWVGAHRTFEALADAVEAAYRRLLESGRPTPAPGSSGGGGR